MVPTNVFVAYNFCNLIIPHWYKQAQRYNMTTCHNSWQCVTMVQCCISASFPACSARARSMTDRFVILYMYLTFLVHITSVSLSVCASSMQFYFRVSHVHTHTKWGNVLELQDLNDSLATMFQAMGSAGTTAYHTSYGGGGMPALVCQPLLWTQCKQWHVSHCLMCTHLSSL